MVAVDFSAVCYEQIILSAVLNGHGVKGQVNLYYLKHMDNHWRQAEVLEHLPLNLVALSSSGNSWLILVES